LEVLVDSIHKCFSLKVVLVFFDVAPVEGELGQVLSEVASFDSLNNCILECLGEESKLLVSIELGAVK